MMNFLDLFRNFQCFFSENDDDDFEYVDLPRPRLKRTVFVCDNEWLPLVSVECEE